MNKFESWLYAGIPEDELPKEQQAAQKKADTLEDSSDAPIDLTVLTEKEIRAPLSAARAYARALKKDNETPKGHYDNLDYMRAIIIIALAIALVYTGFGLMIKLLGRLSSME